MIDWTADQSDHFIGTTAAILSAVAAGAAASSSIYASHKQGSAATEAAKLQTDAAKYGADKQDAATQRAEAFQRQQAENAYLNAQSTQRANYEQAKSRLGTIAGVGAQYGLSGISMPDYVPGIDPHYDTGASPLPGADASGATVGAPPTTAGGAPAIDASKGDLAGQISSYFKSRGVSDHETPYWVSKWSEFGAKDPAYFNQRLAAADVFGGGGAARTPASTIGSFVSPSFAPLAPTTPMPTLYQPGTLGASLRRL